MFVIVDIWANSVVIYLCSSCTHSSLTKTNINRDLFPQKLVADLLLLLVIAYLSHKLDENKNKNEGSRGFLNRAKIKQK